MPVWYFDIITSEFVNSLPRPWRDLYIALCVISYWLIWLTVVLTWAWVPLCLWAKWHPRSFNKVLGRYYRIVD